MGGAFEAKAGEMTQTQPISPIEVVNQQAEDEGLWFIAQTAPEAYLQQELRRLHEAVEAANKRGAEMVKEWAALLRSSGAVVAKRQEFYERGRK